MEFEEGFSIVICTHNGEKKLPETLIHLAALQSPGVPVEIILVNNASTDNTKQLSLGLWQKQNEPFVLKIIDEQRAGKGYAIETGYDAAQYAYIITVDDDNWLQEDYLVKALELIKQFPDVGIFQAGNEPVFESKPVPDWLNIMEHYLVIGSPVKETGYFLNNMYGIWGAGMSIKKADWQYLRNLGFAALTSKIPGKAAGEDIELAVALRLMGRKIYYSPLLCYKHFMPAGRLKWNTLVKNFKTFGYTDYYFFLYSTVFEAYQKNYTITVSRFRVKLLKQWLKMMKSRGIKENIKYFFKKEKLLYQLIIIRYYNVLYWFYKLSGNAVKDTRFIQSWMLPLLKTNPDNFRM